MPYSYIVEKVLIGLDQSVGHTVQFLLDEFLSSPAGKWLTDKEILVEYSLLDAPDQFGMWVIFYINISEEDYMIYKLAFK
jgi:hypothetical protein